jgi:hypothetical protein
MGSGPASTSVLESGGNGVEPSTEPVSTGSNERLSNPEMNEHPGVDNAKRNNRQKRRMATSEGVVDWEKANERVSFYIIKQAKSQA